jgi:hypothetical protein
MQNPNQFFSPEAMQQMYAQIAALQAQGMQMPCMPNGAPMPQFMPFPCAPQAQPAPHQAQAQMCLPQHMPMAMPAIPGFGPGMPKGAMVASSFNNMLREFLVTLKETFEEKIELTMAIQALDMTFKDDPTEALTGWTSAMAKLKKLGWQQPFFADRTPEKVEAFLKAAPTLPYIGRLPLVDMWNDPELDEDDRAGIWDHLHQLEMVALAINAFNGKALGAIENLASRYMERLQAMGTSVGNMSVRDLGMDVIGEVLNDEELKKALKDPDNEKHFESSFGKDPKATIKRMLAGQIGNNEADAVMAQIGSTGELDPQSLADVMQHVSSLSKKQ